MKVARLDFSEGLQSKSVHLLRRINKYIGKRLPQMFYLNMKICFDLFLSTSEFPWQGNDGHNCFFYLHEF